MKKELEMKLVEKYPKLFKHYGKSPQETCMAWGCEHGDGWYNILDELCEKLSQLKFHKTLVECTRVPRNPLCEWLFNRSPSWNILDKLFLKEIYNTIHVEGITFDQIKEKFGTLRIYTNGCPEVIYTESNNYIQEAESKSETTCEQCGEIGTLKVTGWHGVTCDKCEEKKE